MIEFGTHVQIRGLNEDVKLVFAMLELPEILGSDVLMDFRLADEQVYKGQPPIGVQ